MKQLLLLVSFLLVALLVLPQSPGTNLRGQVRTTDPSSRSAIALPKIAVDLYKKNTDGNAWILVASTVSDQNGLYYFSRVAYGNYFIQLNKRKNYDITVVRIDERRLQFQDLPLLVY